MLFVILGSTTLSYSQSEKEIVSKYRDALHKVADEKSVQSMALKGTFTSQKLSFPAAIYYRAPNLRVEMSFQSLMFLQISNDSIRWEYNPMEEKNTITPITKKDDWTAGTNSFDFINYDLLNYKELKHKLKIVGKEKVDSLDVYVLELSKNDKTRTKFLINTKNGLIYKIEDLKGYRYFANYSNQNGYVFPRYIMESGQNRDLEAHFSQLTFNVNLPDSLFVIPEDALAGKDVKTKNNRSNVMSIGDSLYANGDYRQAVQHYTKAIKANEENEFAYNARGLAKLALKEYYEAIADFNTAAEINPLSANPRNNLGLAKYYLGDHTGALKDYDKALGLDPNLGVAYNNRGIIYLEDDKNELAEKDFSAVIKLDSTNGLAHFRLGVALAEQEKYEAALESYARARRNKYNSADVHNYQGVSEYRLERYDSATACFKRALSLEPMHLQYIENYGRALYELGNYKAASEQFENYLNEKDDNASIYNLRGLCKFNDQDYHGAIDDFSKSIKLNEKEATYYDNRASAKEMIEDYEGAIKDYGESIRVYPNDPNVFYRRGMIKINTSKKLEGCMDLATANEMKYEPANEAIISNCH